MNQNRGSGAAHAFAALMLILAVGIVHAQTMVNRVSFTGTVGQSRIGMTLLINTAGSVVGGHYFYAKYLKDIPLKAGTQGSGIILFEPEGGQFALRFKGNGSEAGKPLNFENSVGMEGRWMKNDSSYPVSLQMEQSSQAPTNARWYQDVTSESDAAFEARVQNFYKAVLVGDRAAAARYVDFPLRINRNGKSRMVNTAALLSAQWNQIFTPACVDAFKAGIPHDLFVRNGQAMLGDGVAWFGPKGAQAINIP
ncbi:hypothetical protein [Edaphobacter dinghuensis]|uniref:Uncharacterized protein n=1 Tax=Edaphobacter dinghuensis TaxID=1560005 RepID=A0A917HP94_9BACT|nr:hypothetical protein [Edaphobacter dinghuensis]GGG85244.1 hypothetical protein GCM10011585_31400 [Edaphobacter dinghuensis]